MYKAGGVGRRAGGVGSRALGVGRSAFGECVALVCGRVFLEVVFCGFNFSHSLFLTWQSRLRDVCASPQAVHFSGALQPSAVWPGAAQRAQLDVLILHS